MPEKEKKVPVKKGREGETRIASWRANDYMREMDRMFEDFTRRFDSVLPPLGGTWLTPRRRWFELPEVRHAYADLIDAGNEYRILAEVPGIPKEKLDITVTDREIRIEGEAKTDIQEEKEGFVRRERGYSKVSRNLTLPEEVMADKAEANLNNGVLEVRVPKKTPTEVTKHKIVVK